MDKEIVRETLDAIVDPCSAVAGVPAGLVEMGLVREIEVLGGPEGATIRVAIGLTEPGCLMGVPFVNEAKKRLEALPGVATVEVAMDHRCDWGPQDMSVAYRRRLEEHRASRRRRLGVETGPRGAVGDAAGSMSKGSAYPDGGGDYGATERGGGR